VLAEMKKLRADAVVPFSMSAMEAIPVERAGQLAIGFDRVVDCN
jgi:hypothetical protein